jgi:putative transposase
MARPLRIEFSGAIYHVMSRGNARQAIFDDAGDYERLRDGLEQTVGRYGWEVLAFAFMPNHMHLFMRTPKPNLSRGMQYLLSGYANWFAKRHQRPGHLFQGRFKGELVEDETYFWTVSRYIHLNPVRGRRPLVTHPWDWTWSSYPGYASRSQRLEWVAYDVLYSAWQGEMGGNSAEAAYRGFVEQGLVELPESPFRKATDGWLLGSQPFIDAMRERMKRPHYVDDVPTSRRLSTVATETVLAAVAEYFGVVPTTFQERTRGDECRDVAAWLTRRWTTATLRELAESFGLSHPGSVSNLLRRADRAVAESSRLSRAVDAIERRLTQTKNEV